MRISEAFKLAWKSILGSKMRSFLTMLGMIIGVGSVITLLGLMQGVTNYLVQSFTDMGTNVLTVSVTNTDTRKIDPDDMYKFVKENSMIFKGVTPKVKASYTVKHESTSYSTTVDGVGEDYLELNNLSLSTGRFISYADINQLNQRRIINLFLLFLFTYSHENLLLITAFLSAAATAGHTHTSAVTTGHTHTSAVTAGHSLTSYIKSL